MAYSDSTALFARDTKPREVPPLSQRGSTLIPEVHRTNPHFDFECLPHRYMYSHPVYRDFGFRPPGTGVTFTCGYRT